MATFDWIILTIYCIGIMVMALYFRARASRGLEEFFIAGRNLPWWVIGFADVAGYTGGGQGFVMILFLSGYAGLWLMARRFGCSFCRNFFIVSGVGDCCQARAVTPR